MKSPSAVFIAQPGKTLLRPETISKVNDTGGNRRNSMNLQGYTLCEVDHGKPGGELLNSWADSTPENPLRGLPCY